MDTYVQHLQRCRNSELRRTLQRMLDPANQTQLLEELPSRKPEYRTHIFLDVSSRTMRHFRMREGTAQVSLLRSFASDLKKGYCPFVAEEHSDRFPFYLQFHLKKSSDIHQLCRQFQEAILYLAQTKPQQCYCFAEKPVGEWLAVRMHWPLLRVSELEAARLNEFALQVAMARSGLETVRHAPGWEMRYNTPLPMLGCGGNVHMCEDCGNLGTRRDSCTSCTGLGLKVVPQNLMQVLVLNDKGEIHSEDQRSLGITDEGHWNLSHTNLSTLQEMLQYTSVRTLLPEGRYLDIHSMAGESLAPPLLLHQCQACHHLMPLRQQVCRCRAKGAGAHHPQRQEVPCHHAESGDPRRLAQEHCAGIL